MNNCRDINFEFIIRKFDYKLPLVGVDLVFLAERRAEIVICIGKLASRIAEINIASRSGVVDMDKATKVLRWYHDALRLLNEKAYMINNPGAYDKKAMTETEAALWISASSRRD